jgi:hypothetical protein
MADLELRLFDFSKSLDAFAPTDNASWQLAEIFNALLEEVKKTHADDPVVQAITPATPSTNAGRSTSNCGTLNAATTQLLGVVRGDRGPSIA